MATLTAGVLTQNIEGWHKARNLIDGSTDQAQYVKLIEEAGELAGNIARGKDVRDDIGDMVVVLINIATRNGYKLEECMQVAWDDIKDRKGKMVNGVFIKEDDLSPWVEGNLMMPSTIITDCRVKAIDSIPRDATHTSKHIQYLKAGPKFWSYFKENAWHILSGEPVGELVELK